MGIELDTSQWPLVVTSFTGEQTLDELEDYIAKYNQIHRRQTPYVAISCMNRYARDPQQIDRMRKWLKETEGSVRDYCLANGIVARTWGFRFVLSAVLLARPMPCPYQVCGTWEEALAFVRIAGEARGLKLPAQIAPPPSAVAG